MKNNKEAIEQRINTAIWRIASAGVELLEDLADALEEHVAEIRKETPRLETDEQPRPSNCS